MLRERGLLRSGVQSISRGRVLLRMGRTLPAASASKVCRYLKGLAGSARGLFYFSTQRENRGSEVLRERRKKDTLASRERPRGALRAAHRSTAVRAVGMVVTSQNLSKFRQNKFCSFSAVSAPIFARKYEFCSISQNLPDIWPIFEILVR